MKPADNVPQDSQIFEQFLNYGQRIPAELQLVAMGDAALPLLESFFNGGAKNAFGVPYRKLGLTVDCAIHVVMRLGPNAKQFEHYLRDYLAEGNGYAAMALGKLGTLQEESIAVLAEALQHNYLVAAEAWNALVKCNATDHPSIASALKNSPIAAKTVAMHNRHNKS